MLHAAGPKGLVLPHTRRSLPRLHLYLGGRYIQYVQHTKAYSRFKGNHRGSFMNKTPPVRYEFQKSLSRELNSTSSSTERAFHIAAMWPSGLTSNRRSSGWIVRCASVESTVKANAPAQTNNSNTIRTVESSTSGSKPFSVSVCVGVRQGALRMGVGTNTLYLGHPPLRVEFKE